MKFKKMITAVSAVSIALSAMTPTMSLSAYKAEMFDQTDGKSGEDKINSHIKKNDKTGSDADKTMMSENDVVTTATSIVTTNTSRTQAAEGTTSAAISASEEITSATTSATEKITAPTSSASEEITAPITSVRKQLPDQMKPKKYSTEILIKTG